VNQRFDGPVDQVAAGDIHNHLPQSGRPLTRAERQDLNKLVCRLEEEGGEPGWQIWRFLHRTIGVDGIESMRIEHRDSAEELLALKLRCVQRKSIIAPPDHAQREDSADSRDAELKKARRSINALGKQVDVEKKRAEDALRTMEQLEIQANRLKKQLERSYDELAAGKKSLAQVSDQLAKMQLLCILMMGIAAITMAVAYFWR
jgi:hypothetical protein